MLSTLDLLLLGTDQRAILFCVVTIALIATFLGRLSRLPWVEAGAFGMIVLSGSAALLLFAFRALRLPLDFYVPCVLLIAIGVAWLFRRLLPPLPAFPIGHAGWAWSTFAILAGVLWVMHIVQLEPSANMSSHHGWYPLYIEGSFQLGRFAEIADMSIGDGYMASIFYNMDLMGLVAFGKGLGLGSAWHVYSAGSVLAALLSMAVLIRSLSTSRLGLLVFSVMVVGLLGTDFLYRSTLARNWGDAFLYLSGALLLAILARGKDVRTVTLWCAATSLFLVFGRHYGAFYAGLIFLVGYLANGRANRDWSLHPWFIMGCLLLLFSAREVSCFIDPPSLYYPGQKLLDVALESSPSLIMGSLNDLGLTTDSTLSPLILSFRNLYLLAFPILLVAGWKQAHSLAHLGWLAVPMGIAVLPQILQYLTLYRSSPDYSKTTLLAVHLMAWYPAFAVTHIKSLRESKLPSRWLAPILALGLVGLVSLLVIKRQSIPFTAMNPLNLITATRDLYQQKNPDYQIAQRILAIGDQQGSDIAAHQILYFHYEPGIGLRNFIGGSLFCDRDFWTPDVQNRIARSANLGDLVAQLGYPNLYLSRSSSLLYQRYYSEAWRKYETEMADIEHQPWVDRVIRYTGPGLMEAIFVIPKRPDAQLGRCAAKTSRP
ncbi:MAG: hypothetical protein AB7G62_08320 [Magnetospirillum sp.]